MRRGHSEVAAGPFRQAAGRRSRTREGLKPRPQHAFSLCSRMPDDSPAYRMFHAGSGFLAHRTHRKTAGAALRAVEMFVEAAVRS